MPRFPRPIFWSPTRGAEVSLMTLAFFLPVASGCVSNEYVIPNDELMHQAQMPIVARGQRVRVLQGIGDRRAEPVAPSIPPPVDVQPLPIAETEPTPDAVGEIADGADTNGDCDGDCDSDTNLQIDIGNSNASGDGPARRRMPTPHRATPARTSGGSNASGGWHASGGGHGSGGWHGPGRVAPTGGGHIGGHIVGGGGGGGGGGGNGGDALVLLAVVAIAIGVVVGIGLVSGEGVRFDGYVQMAPEQPIHIKDGYGQTREVALAALSPEDVQATVEAKVMDDEGYGIERLDRAPLDRTGGTFKLDSGETTFGLGPSSFYGPTATIQFGYFFTRELGLLMNVTLGGSADDQGMIVTRHTFSLELQALPLAKGRFHAGGYVDAGFALAGLTSNDVLSGPAGGGGVLVELDLTSRLALTLRGGANLAHLDDGWSPAGTLALGVAVY